MNPKIALATLAALAIISATITTVLYCAYSFSKLYSGILRSPYDLAINLHFTQEQLARIDYLLRYQYIEEITCTNYGNCWVSDRYSYFQLDQVGLSQDQLSLLEEYSKKQQNSTLLWGGLVTGALLLAFAVIGILLLIEGRNLCSIAGKNEKDFKPNFDLTKLIFADSQENLSQISL